MTRTVKDVLQFCTDVVHRQPHRLDHLMDLLNLDSDELLTNANLQQITHLLKNHHDLLTRFGQIFLPPHYKLCPWKDMVDGRVYCMLQKGEALYKLTSLDSEQQQFDAIEAARRHEAQERRSRTAAVARVPDDNTTTTSSIGSSSRRQQPRRDVARVLPDEMNNMNGNVPQQVARVPVEDDSSVELEKRVAEIVTTTSTTSTTPTPPQEEKPKKLPVVIAPPPSHLIRQQQQQPTVPTTSRNKRPINTVLLVAEPEARRGSRSRPGNRQYTLAVPFLNDLCLEELQEFLHHKGLSAIHDKATIVQNIINDCKLSIASPFEVLPTFLKNFKSSDRRRI